MLDQITLRLASELPRGVPLLQPDQLLTPAEWEEEDEFEEIVPNGKRGLMAYLEQKAPQGYVQLYDLQPLSTGAGWADQHFLTVDVLAATEAHAQALTDLVRRTLGSTPRTGGRIRLTLPARVAREPGSVRITQQFTVRTAHPR